jgi:hypothetical protein
LPASRHGALGRLAGVVGEAGLDRQHVRHLVGEPLRAGLDAAAAMGARLIEQRARSEPAERLGQA